MKITVFQIQPIERLRSQLIIKLVLLALITTMVIITVPSVLGMAIMPDKHTISGAGHLLDLD
jgi:hypothetical protein